MNKQLSTKSLFIGLIIGELGIGVILAVKSTDSDGAGFGLFFDILFLIATLIAWLIDWRISKSTKKISRS